MRIRKEILLLIVCAVILTPILFFPLSNDLSIFYHAAKTILNGGKLYVDYIDIKPPFGYILFIPVVLFSGQSEFLLRLSDFILQLLLLFFLFKLIHKKTNNDIIPFLAAIIYSLSYVAFNFNQTMQLESFMGFIVLLLISVQVSDVRKNYIWLIRGVLLGLLISIKFTAFIVYFSFIIDDFFSHKTSKPLIIQGLTFISLSITLLLANILLFDSEIFSGFTNALKYLMIYGSQPSFDLEFLKFSLKQISHFLADNLSLSLLILSLLGIFYTLKKDLPEGNKKLLNFSITILIFLFASIILEKKYFEYHFLRIYIPLSILAAFGLYELLRELKEKILKFNLQVKFISFSALIFFLIFSPLPRWFQTLVPTYYYFTSKEKYNLFYERQWTSSVLRKTSMEVASFLNHKITPDDKIIVISNINNQLNFFIEKGVKSRFALSCFYLSSYNIDNFEKLFIEELNSADWIVIQTNDGNIYAMGHLFSSYDALIQNKEYSQLFLEHFYEVKDFKLFKVFARK